MGNSSVAGHLVHKTGLTTAYGLRESLQVMMTQQGVSPWSAKELLQSKLQKQQELSQRSPLRYIAVEEGLRFFATEAGGLFKRMTRDKFVRMACDLVRKNADKIKATGWQGALDYASALVAGKDARRPRMGSVFTGGAVSQAWDATEFYDVFDAVNLYGGADLSVGELAGCLEVFFWGSLENRVRGVFKLLGGDESGEKELTEEAFAVYCKPFVWSCVPDASASLRPVLLDIVVKDLFEEMDANKNKKVGLEELIKWHQVRHGNNVADRSAGIVEGVVYAEWLKIEERKKMLAYGNKTYEAQFGTPVPAWKQLGQVSPATHVLPTVQPGVMYQAIQSSAPVTYIAGMFGGQPAVQVAQGSPRARAVSIVSVPAEASPRARAVSVVSVQQSAGSGSVVLPAPPPAASSYQYNPATQRKSVFTAAAVDAQASGPTVVDSSPRRSVVQVAAVTQGSAAPQPVNGVVWQPKHFQPLQIPALQPVQQPLMFHQAHVMPPSLQGGLSRTMPTVPIVPSSQMQAPLVAMSGSYHIPPQQAALGHVFPTAVSHPTVR